MNDSSAVNSNAPSHREAVEALVVLSSVLTILLATIYFAFVYDYTDETINSSLKKAGAFEKLDTQGFVSLEFGGNYVRAKRQDGAFAENNACYGGTGGKFSCHSASYTVEVDVENEGVTFGFFTWFFETAPNSEEMKEMLLRHRDWQWEDGGPSAYEHLKYFALKGLKLIAMVLTCLFMPYLIFKLAVCAKEQRSAK